ncbi:MAG: glycosyltransferase family 4 protein [Candidatus Portnoybacteria bacterium]|nr:glycosyltransferase family 4 protein [Candidatus Portnoybacteria bacterium]
MNKENKIKIGIDARFYGPKQTGPGRYVQKLVQGLEENDKVNQYLIFLRKDNWNEYQPKNPNFKKILADYPWYGIKEQVLMPFKIHKEKLDLMHFPHFNVPLFCFCPFVITIHDLILKRFPTRRASTLGPIRYWLKNLAYQIVIFSAAKRAKRIISISEFTKNDILKYFKVKPEKMEMIYEGVSDFDIDNSKGIDKKVVLNKYGIKKPYILYVGNSYPHKNLGRLILAFDKLRKEKKDLNLVLAGRKEYFYNRLEKEYTGFKNIIFTDFVLDKDLSVLYQNASLYVFPSLCEGFGLPPLEAMLHNLPVVCSDSSCLPEVLGSAAIYFDPENIDDMTDKLRQVLNNEKLQQELIQEGRKQINKYSWNKMGKETAEVYNSF